MRSGVKGVLPMALVLCFFSLFIFSRSYSADRPIETGIIQEIGEDYILIRIEGGKGFKDGEKLKFYFHPKTKIILANSKTPLTIESLLVGDKVNLMLGKVKIDSDGTAKCYVECVEVLEEHRKKK